MRSRIAGFLAALLLAIVAAAPTLAVEPPRSGHPVFDRAVRLVIDNFYDVSALDRFVEAVRQEIDDPRSPLTAASPPPRVDAKIPGNLLPHPRPGNGSRESSAALRR